MPDNLETLHLLEPDFQRLLKGAKICFNSAAPVKEGDRFCVAETIGEYPAGIVTGRSTVVTTSEADQTSGGVFCFLVRRLVV